MQFHGRLAMIVRVQMVVAPIPYHPAIHFHGTLGSLGELDAILGKVVPGIWRCEMSDAWIVFQGTSTKPVGVYKPTETFGLSYVDDVYRFEINPMLNQ